MLSPFPFTGTFSGSYSVSAAYGGIGPGQEVSGTISVTIAATSTQSLGDGSYQAYITGSVSVTGFLGQSATYPFGGDYNGQSNGIETETGSTAPVPSVQINISAYDPGSPLNYVSIVGSCTNNSIDANVNIGMNDYVTPNPATVILAAAPSTPTPTPTPAPTILIAINNTVSTNDNITLYNPPGSAQPFTQTIPAKITNLGSEAATFQLTVDHAGSGNVTLSQTSLDLASGASAEIMITPTADSSVVNDVHIVAVDDDGTQLAEDDMTVVRVTLPNTISDADTPQTMLDAGAYRIPPRVSTAENIQVTPNLSGSGQSVTLTVSGQSATNGTVTIGGGAAQTITADGNVQLSSPSGNTQTAPGSAAQLHLALQVRGENTIQSANGFSVAAIPIYLYDVFWAHVKGNQRGIRVANFWKSDSGMIGDLNQVTVQEQVQLKKATGIFHGRKLETSGPDSGTTVVDPQLFPSQQYPNLGVTYDDHIFPLSFITAALYTGTRQAQQTSDFVDYRTGSPGPITDKVPMANSGDVITQTVYTVTTGTGKKRTVTVMVRTTETGAKTSANGIASDPVTTYPSAAGPPGPIVAGPPGPISDTEVAEVLPK